LEVVVVMEGAGDSKKQVRWRPTHLWVRPPTTLEGGQLHNQKRDIWTYSRDDTQTVTSPGLVDLCEILIARDERGSRFTEFALSPQYWVPRPQLESHSDSHHPHHPCYHQPPWMKIHGATTCKLPITYGTRKVRSPSPTYCDVPECLAMT
jgi:hypothetical protein